MVKIAIASHEQFLQTVTKFRYHFCSRLDANEIITISRDPVGSRERGRQ